MWVVEEGVHELGGGWHEAVSRRAEYGEGALAVFEPGRKDQSGEVAAVIDVKMAEEKDVRLRHLCSALAKAESTASTRVEDHARTTVLPYEIAG